MANPNATTYFRTQYFKRPVPSDAADLSAWLTQELQTIQAAIRPPSSRTVSADTLASPLYRFLECDTTNGSFTITLPDAMRVHDMEITLKKTDAAANTVTVVALGGLIDGATSTTLATRWGSKTLYSDGHNWYIIAVVP
jgi:hypothetical protein